MADSTRDARGCLTPAGIDVVRQAPAGAAPPELASHLASCTACQDRLLATESLPRSPGASPKKDHLWRTLLVFLLILVAATLALVSSYWLIA
jgi:hypothetical protein